MRKLTEQEMRALDGGKTRYTKCPECGATYKEKFGYLKINLHRAVMFHLHGKKTIVFYK